MQEKNPRSEQLTQFFVKWTQSEAKIRLYGPAMPQSKHIMEEIHHALGDILQTLSSFSIVRNSHGFEMVTHETTASENPSCPLETSDYTLQAAQAFERVDIHSITFHRDISLVELEAFFGGLHLSPAEIKQQKGLATYLKERQVQHIEIDRIRMAAHPSGSHRKSKDVSRAAEEALADLMRQTTPGLMAKEAPTRKKAFASTWERYLADQIPPPDFKSSHQAMVTLAQEKPEMFVRVLQHMAAKQESIETFLANLEEKLLKAGFPGEEVGRILHKLGKPKQVLIDEAELARLRQIEQNYQPDLTERIEESLARIDTLEKNLSAERERGDALLRQSHQGVMVLDKDGRILETNPIAEKVLGVSAQESRGKHLKEVVQQYHMVSVVSNWKDESEEFIPKEVQIEAGDEQTIDTLRESGIVIEDKNGRSIGGVAALPDVVRQQDIEKRKNDILDVLGHDLRAPLNIVKQNIDLIADFLKHPDALPPDKQQEFLAACKRHIDRMEKLINKVLDVRQLETGKITLKREQAAANKIVEDAAHSLDSWAQDKNITITIDTEPLPELYCDPERIYQIITNLISNALKFTPEGGQIQVSGKPVEADGSPCIEVSVTDSGMGIAEEDLKRIFNKYEQVSLKQPVGVSGLGLGLSICKTIVEMHQGRIWATSEVGTGSAFSFQIPLTLREDDANTEH